RQRSSATSPPWPLSRARVYGGGTCIATHFRSKSLKEVFEMARRVPVLFIFLMIFGLACGSINRATPSSMDDTAMKTDVKGKILATDPGKVFDIGVEVHDGVVTLNGKVNTDAERTAIVDAANSVHGVKRVINN